MNKAPCDPSSVTSVQMLHGAIFTAKAAPYACSSPLRTPDFLAIVRPQYPRKSRTPTRNALKDECLPSLSSVGSPYL